MKKIVTLVSVMVLVAGVCMQAMAGHGEEKEMKRGILLVAFGTSEPKAMCSFENIERLTRKRFPGTEVRWAYTSGIIRRKLAKGKVFIDSPTVALSKMYDEGFTSVAVQSLHSIGGAEYDKLKDIVSKFRQGSEAFEHIVLGAPLLNSFADLQRVAGLMLKEVPKSRKSNEAVVLMGHGTEHHYSDLAYVAAAKVFGDMDPLAFVGTVEGHPTIDDVLAQCKAAKVKKAYLMPFMSVAGDHARNDMASDEDDSWKSVLEKNGIECVAVLKGTAEYDSIASVWVDHLSDVMNTSKHK